MKSVKSFFNKDIFKDLLKRHWWVGFINLIVLFFAIPINFLVTSQRYSFRRFQDTEVALAELHKYTTSFFSLATDGVLIIIVMVAMLSALLAGLVLFSYLHKKDQVNFFHSQPVSRETLFVVRIVAGIVLFAIPYLINLVIALVVAGLKGLIGLVGLPGLLAQIGFVLLVFAVIFALVVLAGILCGTVFAQVQITMLLMFAPLLVYSSLVMICQRFYSTFYADYYFQKVINYSPVTHLISLLDGQARLNVGVILIYLVIVLMLLTMALWLYRRRPSEGAGIPLVFNISRPIVKYISCFIAAALLGMFFDQLAGTYFMIFGFVAGALLCSFFAETQIHRDFKAMFRNLKGLAVFGVGFALLVGAIAYDVNGYDNYLPEPGQVKAVSFTWDDGDVRPIPNSMRHYPGQDLEVLTFSSPTVKTELLSIVGTTLKNGSFMNEPRGGNNGNKSVTVTQPDYTNTRYLTVVYKLESGRQVPRRYSAVNLVPIKDEVQKILSSDEYKSKHAIMAVANSLTPTNMNIEPVERSLNNYRVAKLVSQEVDQAKLVQAIKDDVQAVGETIDQPVVYTVTCEHKEYSARINIYENYQNTIKLINEISSPTDQVPINPDLLQVKKLEVRRRGNTLGLPVVIGNPQQIEQVLKASKTNWGDAMTLADEYVISIPLEQNTLAMKDAYAKEMAIKAEESKEVRYFVIGKVPEFIKAEVK